MTLSALRDRVLRKAAGTVAVFLWWAAGRQQARLRRRHPGIRTAITGRRTAPLPMTCGRRYDGMTVREWPVDPPREDHWRTDGGLIGQGAVGTSCSYCGSLHPDALMARLADGWTLEGSDKTYKWYLRNDDGRTVAKFYTVHLRRDQAELLLNNLGNGLVRHSLYVRPWLPSLSEAAPSWLADG